MSDTPRTDAAVKQYDGSWFAHEGPAANLLALCRELERECDEWKGNAKSLLRSLRDEEAKAEANERDAERYRYLRDKEDGDMFMENVGSDLDRAIDAARSAEKEKE